MRSTAQRLLLVALSAVLLALSTGMAWATVNDYGSRTLVSAGVTIGGTDLSGMTASQARAAIRQSVSSSLLRPVTVTTDGRSLSFNPANAVRVDLDAMLDQAYAPRRTASFLSRLRHDLAGSPLSAEVRPAYTIDDAAVTSWVEDVAKEIDTPAVEATRTIVNGDLRIRKSSSGRKTDVAQAVRVLKQAVATEANAADASRAVSLPVDSIAPKITEKSLGKTIVVDLSLRRVRLYNGARIEKTYRCAVGTPGHPTPTGVFKIVNKRFMPSWHNPAPTGWGASMPAYIAPGPSNPLGTRALDLSAPGIRFHGTTQDGSIGSAASHGCMRMHRRDIEDFFPRVPVGTPVYILP